MSALTQPQKAKDDKAHQGSVYEFVSTSPHEVVSKRVKTAFRTSAKRQKKSLAEINEEWNLRPGKKIVNLIPKRN